MFAIVRSSNFAMALSPRALEANTGSLRFSWEGTGVLPIASDAKALQVGPAICFPSYDRILVRVAGKLSKPSNWPSEPMTPAGYFGTTFSECLFYLVGPVRSNPDDRSNSLTSYAASTCMAFLSTASRRGPRGSICACSRRRFASAARRASKGWVCLKRRRFCMRCSLPQEEAGAHRAFSSPIDA
jgi:hypothetical protein